MPSNDYVTTVMLARQLGIQRISVEHDIARGILPAVKIGRYWAIRALDIEQYVNLRVKMSQSISARELARRTGQKEKRKIIAEVLRKGDLPAFRVGTGKSASWYILEEDARSFSQRMGWNYRAEEGPPQVCPPVTLTAQSQNSRLVVMTRGTPDECGSCGSTTGNILGDVDSATSVKYGYLCMKCYRLVHDFQGDPDRMRAVLDYIERTRFNKKAQRHKKIPIALQSR